jgi:hypothetical protein
MERLEGLKILSARPIALHVDHALPWAQAEQQPFADELDGAAACDHCPGVVWEYRKEQVELALMMTLAADLEATMSFHVAVTGVAPRQERAVVNAVKGQTSFPCQVVSFRVVATRVWPPQKMMALHLAMHYEIEFLH